MDDPVGLGHLGLNRSSDTWDWTGELGHQILACELGQMGLNRSTRTPDLGMSTRAPGTKQVNSETRSWQVNSDTWDWTGQHGHQILACQLEHLGLNRSTRTPDLGMSSRTPETEHETHIWNRYSSRQDANGESLRCFWSKNKSRVYSKTLQVIVLLGKVRFAWKSEKTWKHIMYWNVIWNDCMLWQFPNTK